MAQNRYVFLAAYQIITLLFFVGERFFPFASDAERLGFGLASIEPVCHHAGIGVAIGERFDHIAPRSVMP